MQDVDMISLFAQSHKLRENHVERPALSSCNHVHSAARLPNVLKSAAALAHPRCSLLGPWRREVAICAFDRLPVVQLRFESRIGHARLAVFCNSAFISGDATATSGL